MAYLLVVSDADPALFVRLDDDEEDGGWDGTCNGPDCRWGLSLPESGNLADSYYEASIHVDHEH